MPEMPFDTFDIEVTLTWSAQAEDGSAPYPGDAGEETRMLADYALLEILRTGLSDGEGNVVTTITIWPPIPAMPQPDRNEDEPTCPHGIAIRICPEHRHTTREAQS
jgi:hypothetical protein